jgi:hypothetical protein
MHEMDSYSQSHVWGDLILHSHAWDDFICAFACMRCFHNCICMHEMISFFSFAFMRWHNIHIHIYKMNLYLHLHALCGCNLLTTNLYVCDPQSKGYHFCRFFVMCHSTSLQAIVRPIYMQRAYFKLLQNSSQNPVPSRAGWPISVQYSIISDHLKNKMKCNL